MWLLDWPGSIPNFQTIHPSRGVREAKVWLTGQDRIQGNSARDATLHSHSQHEESPSIQHKPLQFPWESPTHSTGRRGQRLQESRAKHCKDSSHKGKIPDRADRKASSTSQSQDNSTLILLDPHSILEHPENRAGAHTRAKKQKEQEVFCKLYTPSTRIPNERSLCWAGRKEKKSWNL